MDVLTYSRNDKNCREMDKIEFHLPDGLTIGEFKIIMVRLAHALGYSSESVDEEFGDLSDPMKFQNTKKILQG